MPAASATAIVNGATIRYRVLGDDGPWVALSPGGRGGMDAIEALGERMATAGHRVLLHDRRNCGASDLVLEGDEPEYQIWADDLHALLGQLDARPAWIGGSSSGARLALTYALTYPESVDGLLLMRVTGGPFPADRLSRMYYGQYIEAARAGGMEAVCETDHFRERLAQRPDQRDVLLSMDVERFVANMEHWRRFFSEGADLPVIGVTPQQIDLVTMPTLIVPGNDNTHSRVTGEALHDLMPDSELHILYPDHVDEDIVPMEQWAPKEPELAAVFADFIRRHPRAA